MAPRPHRTAGPSRPAHSPRLARLVLRLVPDPAREFVAGDLEEEYAERRRGPQGGSPGLGARIRADLWFWRQVLASVFAFLGFRSSERTIHGPAGSGPLRFDGVAHDLRLAARGLVRRPAFALAAVLTLGLGIGTSATMFAAVDAAFFRPLNLEKPEQLLRVWMGNRETGYTTNPFTIRDYLDWREISRTVDLAIYGGTGMNVTTGDDTEWRMAVRGSANLMSVLGARPELGRGFLPEEEWEGAPLVVVLSYDYWKSRFGSDPDILGQTVILNGEAHAIVGVLPPNGALPNYQGVDFWVPLPMTGTEPRGDRSYWGLGRMKEGVTLQQAQADLQSVAQTVAASDPGHPFPDATIISYQDGLYGPEAGPISVAFGGAVLFVLLIACANIANLLLARGIDRGQEFAIRSAMGGGRGRVLRHILTEVGILALAGGLVGVFLTDLGIRLMRASIIPQDLQVELDTRVLATCVLLTAASALIFGLLPAVLTSRVDLRSRLQAGTRGVLGGGKQRLGRLMVVGQVGMVMALLVSSGLIIKSLQVLNRVDLGFRTQGVFTFRVSPPSSRYPDEDDIRAFHRELRERIAGLPMVEAVGLNDNNPMGFGSATGFTIPGREEGESDVHRSTQLRVVDQGYRDVLDLERLAGRWVDETADARDGTLNAVLSRTLAEALWGNPGAALGRTMEAYDTTFRVVGVVEAGRMLGPDQAPPFVLFLPLPQHLRRSLTYVVKTPADATTLLPLLRRELVAMDRSVALQGPRTLEAGKADATEPQRISLSLFLVFGALAMALTLVGVFGVVSHEVSRRSQEMGLRLALGSDRGALVRHVVLRNGRTAALGLALGVVLSLAFGRIIGSLFAGIRMMEGDVLLLVVALTAGAMAAATYLPARRASRVDPVRTLNAD